MVCGSTPGICCYKVCIMAGLFFNMFTHCVSISGLLSKFAMLGFFIMFCIFSVEPVPLAPGFIIFIACFIISGLFIISLNIGLFIISSILFGGFMPCRFAPAGAAAPPAPAAVAAAFAFAY